MVQRNKCPVRHDAGDSLLALVIFADNEVLHSSRIHHDHIREGQDFGKDSGGEQRSVFYDHESSLVFKWHTELGQKAVRRLADDLVDTTGR